MSDIERAAVDAVAEFLHTDGPPLNADDAAVAIVDALTAAGFEVVPADQLRGAVEALRDLLAVTDHRTLNEQTTGSYECLCAACVRARAIVGGR